MTRDELIDYLANLDMDTRTGLLDLFLDQLRRDRNEIDVLTKRADQAVADAQRWSGTLDFNRAQHERQLDELRQRWNSSEQRLRAHLDRTHHIGQAVLAAKFAGRKTVRIADLLDEKDTPK